MKIPAPLLALGLAGSLGAWLGCEHPLMLWIYPALFLIFTVSGWRLGGMTGTVSVWLAGAVGFMFYADARTHYFSPNHLTLTMSEPRMVEFKIRALEDAALTVNARGAGRLEFLAEALESRDEGAPVSVSGRLRVVVREPGALRVEYGEELRAAGYAQPITPPTEPGEFDARGYYRARGVFHEFAVDPALTVKLGNGGGNYLQYLAFQLRRSMREALRAGLENSPETTALMAGMLFGDKGAVPEDIKEKFRVTGTQHIFAVSGLHVATVLAVLMVTLELAGVVRWRWAWLLLPALLVFCLATGMRPSAFRALVMIALVTGGWLLLRPANVFNLLGAAALALLAWEPRQILDTGFQLSFCVVFGMALGGGWLYQIFYEKLKPDPWIPRRLLSPLRVTADKSCRVICAAAATSVTAWLASLPVLIWNFHMVSPVTPLANMVIVPFAGLVVTVAALSVTLGWLWHWFSLLLNQVNWLALKVMVFAAGFFAQLPGSHFYVGVSGVPRDTARFTFFAQRELAPALLQYNGGNWLIGSGAEALWRCQINPYRKGLGINSFDAVILPRAGAQAMGAAVSVSGEVAVRTWVEGGYAGRAPGQRQFLDQLRAGKQFWRRDDVFALGDTLTVSVLAPAESQRFDNQGDAGLVLRFAGPEGALLYAGNISKKAEAELLMSGQNLRADCLVQGQNARQNLSREWLLAVRPKWLVRPARGYSADISLTREFWQTAWELGIEVLRMEECGALTVELSPKGCQLRPFHQPPGMTGGTD
ncbi:MAG: ComEC/Rec2 family competence protein [Verrucomicrobiales bacterium]|jgi:ComEC/Rec2-related protein|nr:ComEC/Rec2 family competence protein [Verrucomicrobiales bacterium]